MNLKQAKEKYIELGIAIENLQQNTERYNLQLIHSALGQFLINELESEWSKAESPSTNYDETFGDEKLCNCGHPYRRHFDSYDDNCHVGCKYCECFDWEPLDPTRIPNIMQFSELKINDIFKRLGDNHSGFITISPIIIDGKEVNCSELNNGEIGEYLFFPDWVKVEKTGIFANI